MDTSIVYEKNVATWQVNNDVATVQSSSGVLILNPTVKIVWELVDGTKDIDKIMEVIYEKYKHENTRLFIESIVLDSISLLKNHEIIKESDNDIFGGWLKYE
jgi:hypothetical protein